MGDFNDPLPSTLHEPALSPKEAARRDHDEQLLSEEARMNDGPSDTTTYVSEQMAREHETRVTLDVLEGLRKLEGGDPIRWTIYRVDSTEPGKLGYLAQWSTARLTQDRLRDEFGPGVYRIEGNLPNGQYVRRRTVTIAEDAPRKLKESATVNTNAGFNMQEFLAHQDAMENRRQQREDERRRREEELEEKRRQERKEMMIALGAPAMAMIGQIFGGKQDNTAALIAAVKGPDPLTMMTQLKALQGSGQDGALTRILPMLIDMAGNRDSGGDTGWLDVIKEFAKSAGPSIGGLIEAQVAAAKAAQTAQVTQAAPSLPAPLATPTLPAPSASATATPSPLIMVPESVPRRERRNRSVSGSPPVAQKDSHSRTANEYVTTAGASSAQGQVDMNLLSLLPHLPWFREILARMLSAAINARDPELYAALFLEELPKGLDLNIVGQLLSAEDWLQKLISLEPRWNNGDLVPWLVTVRNLILQSVSNELSQGNVAPNFASHAPPQPSLDQRAGVMVDVRGPEAQAVGVPHGRAPPARARTSGEIDRPTRLPSLTGD